MPAFISVIDFSESSVIVAVTVNFLSPFSSTVTEDDLTSIGAALEFIVILNRLSTVRNEMNMATASTNAKAASVTLRCFFMTLFALVLMSWKLRFSILKSAIFIS